MILNEQKNDCKCDWCGKRYKLNNSTNNSNPENWCSVECEGAEVALDIAKGVY